MLSWHGVGTERKRRLIIIIWVYTSMKFCSMQSVKYAVHTYSCILVKKGCSLRGLFSMFGPVLCLIIVLSGHSLAVWSPFMWESELDFLAFFGLWLVHGLPWFACSSSWCHWWAMFCDHYVNELIQIYWKFYNQKTENFQIKKSDIFHISAQNIDCGYSLEPPRRGGSNEYPQSMFLSRNKKNNVYPVNPSFTI